MGYSAVSRRWRAVNPVNLGDDCQAGAEPEEVRCGVSQVLPGVEPLGVLIAEFDDVGQVNKVFEDGYGLGLAAEQGGPDVGVIGDRAFLLHCCRSDVTASAPGARKVAIEPV